MIFFSYSTKMSILVAGLILALLSIAVYFGIHSQSLAKKAAEPVAGAPASAPVSAPASAPASAPGAPGSNPALLSPTVLDSLLSKDNKTLTMVINQGSINCLKNPPPGVTRDVLIKDYVNGTGPPGSPPWLCMTDGTADEKDPNAIYFWKQFKSRSDPDFILYTDMQLAAVRAKYAQDHPLKQKCNYDFIKKVNVCKMVPT